MEDVLYLRIERVKSAVRRCAFQFPVSSCKDYMVKLVPYGTGACGNIL